MTSVTNIPNGIFYLAENENMNKYVVMMQSESKILKSEYSLIGANNSNHKIINIKLMEFNRINSDPMDVRGEEKLIKECNVNVQMERQSPQINENKEIENIKEIQHIVNNDTYSLISMISFYNDGTTQTWVINLINHYMFGIDGGEIKQYVLLE